MTKKAPKGKSDEPRRRRQHDTIADWGGVDSGLIRQVIEQITKRGGAVRFGYTRDGGAYSLGIYGDGKPFSEFCPANSDVASWLEGIVYDYE